MLRLALFVGCLALLIRVIYLIESAENPFREHLLLDARHYHLWAARIAGGAWIGSEPFLQAPLYPYFLGLCYALLGSEPARALWVQALLGALTAGAGAYLAGRRWGRIAAWTTGLLLALYQPGIFYSGVLLAPVLAAALLMLALLLGRRHSFWGGLATGLAALAHPLLLPGGLIATYAITERRGRRRLLALLAGCALAIAPATLYNAVAAGAFIPIAANAGVNLHIGHGPRATGFYVPPAGPHGTGDIHGIAQASAITGRDLSPVEASRFWRARAWEAMREDPLRTLQLTARKLYAFLQGYEVPQVESLGFERRYSTVLRLPFLPGWLALLALAMTGWATRRRERAYAGLLLAVAATAIAGSLFFVTARFRFPVHIYLALASGAGVAGLLKQRRRRAAALLPALGMLVLFGPAWSTATRPTAHGEFHYRLGQIAEREEDPRAALEHYRQALEHAPGNYEAAVRLGLLYARAGNLDRAQALLEGALRYAPRHARALFTLGQVHQVRGALDIARAYYAEAVAADPGHVRALESLATCAYLAGDVAAAQQNGDTLLAQIGPKAPLGGRMRFVLGRLQERRAHGWSLGRGGARAEGDLAFGAGDWETAREHYRAALEQEPDDLATLLELYRLAHRRQDAAARDRWRARYLSAGGPADALAPADSRQ